MLTEEEQQLLDQVTEEAHSNAIPNNPQSLMVDDNTTRFRSATWYEEAQKHTIIVAGQGGIGSWTTLLLSRLQPNALYLYDDDRVERVNMAGQLYSINDVEKYKVYAISDIVSLFSNYNSVFSIDEKYTLQSPPSPIMICGFDNMTARRMFFLNWRNYVGTLTEEDKKTCLFIDGRMSAEYFQIFCITGDDLYNIKRYEKEFLFDDSEAEVTVCSYKQTSFCSSMIASFIVNLYVNFCANRCNPIIPRSLPFITEYNAEITHLKLES